MNIVIVYIFPLSGAGNFYELAIRFLQSYHDHPPGMEHQSVIVCNGAPANDETKFLFSSLPNLRFLEHDNSGWDVGAFQLAARTVPADMMMFLGAETYFRGSGWLKRFADVWQKYGDGLYGSTGNQGDARFNVWPHIRTTGFCCSPATMNNHPMRVTGGGELRYPWEHGEHGLTSWCLQQNKRVYVVSWDNVWPVQSCDQIVGGYHNNNQENVIVGDRLTAPPYGPCF